jgi:hypothetical protein
MKDSPKYMINNDVFTDRVPLTNYETAYYTFISTIINVTKVDRDQIV